MPIKRTKTGCIPCRLARRKCDETKPTCQRCGHQNKTCVWPSSPNQSMSQILAINNVSDYAVLLPKRFKRVRSGCIRCREMKKKCDELKPNCTRCDKRGIRCQWNNKMIENVDKSFDGSFVSFKCVLPQPILTSFVPGFLFNFFFNSTIAVLVPPQSIQSISDITLKTCRHDSFEKILEFLSAAHLFNIDNSKSMIIETLHSSALSSVLKTKLNSVTLELRLKAFIFSILGMTFIGVDNDKILKYVYLSLDLILKHNPSPASMTFYLLLESFIYNYSVSVIITPPVILAKYDPFFVCDSLQQFVPSGWNNDETPFLGISLDLFLIAAKISGLFQTKSTDFIKHQRLLEKLEQLSLKQPCVVQISTESEYMTVPKSRTNSLMIAACKILLWYLLPQNNNEKIKTLVEETIIYLQNSTRMKKDETVFALWGVFIIGLQLKKKEQQNYLITMLHEGWEKRKNLGWLKAINNLQIVWNNDLDLEVLYNKEFMSNVCLN